MARGTTTSTLTAQTDNIKATETIDGRTGGAIRPALIAPSPRRRQRRLHSQELPSAGRAGSGFPRMDRRVARWGPRITSHTAQPGPSRAVSYPWTRNVDPISLHGRDHGVEYKPVIDTAPKINRLTKRLINRTTDRLTTGEGHVVRYGDVRRVRKVIVDCSASRPLRGQSPVHNSSRYVHRTETVRNRLIRKPTTKPLPQPVAEAQTQEPRNRQGKEGPKPPIKRA